MDVECCICLNKYVNPKKLLCGHFFCKECILNWFKYHLSCPVCREIVKIGYTIHVNPPVHMLTTLQIYSFTLYLFFINLLTYNCVTALFVQYTEQTVFFIIHFSAVITITIMTVYLNTQHA